MAEQVRQIPTARSEACLDGLIFQERMNVVVFVVELSIEFDHLE